MFTWNGEKATKLGVKVGVVVLKWGKGNFQDFYYIFGRGVLTPLFHEDTPPPILSTPLLFQILWNPTPTVLSVVLFLWLNGWSYHIWCAILLNDNMDLHMSLGTLVPEGLWCVLCNKASSLLRSDTQCVYLLLLWFDITGKHTNTYSTLRGHYSELIYPYKCIFIPPVMGSQQLPLLH